LLREAVDGEWISSADLMNRAEALLALPATARSEPLMAFRPTEAELDGAMLELEQCFQGSGSKGRDWGKMRSYAQMVCTVRHLARLPQSETPAGGTAKVPEGWKLVPVEPTHPMWSAAIDAYYSIDNADGLRGVLRAAIAAAPSPDGNEESK
jgi:hypothetical protein